MEAHYSLCLLLVQLYTFFLTVTDLIVSRGHMEYLPWLRSLQKAALYLNNIHLTNTYCSQMPEECVISLFGSEVVFDFTRRGSGSSATILTVDSSSDEAPFMMPIRSCTRPSPANPALTSFGVRATLRTPSYERVWLERVDTLAICL